jgi:uncharacterized iron-regulated protein
MAHDVYADTLSDAIELQASIHAFTREPDITTLENEKADRRKN